MESLNAEYFALRRRVKREGLLQACPNFYVRKFAEVHALLLTSLVALICWGDTFWIQMANAAFLAFTFGRCGFLMHDVGHRPSGRRHQRPLRMYLNVLLGWCMDWWEEKHNRHHKFANQIGHDPDINIKYLAFTEDQARQKRGFCWITTRYQHFSFLLLLLGELWHLRVACIAYSWRAKTRRANMDLACMAMHMGIYVSLLVMFTPHAFAFMLVHSSLVGVYIGLTFAPNHKGMPIIEHGTILDFLRQQVLTARNIRGGGRVRDALIGYFTGGLNHQIEHHLFPAMSPGYYRAAAVIVEEYCKEIGVPYHAVSLWGAICEVFVYFRRIGRCATGSSFS